MSKTDIMVACRGVSKRFGIPSSPHGTLRGRLLHPLERTTWRRFEALDDITFEVPRGEFFGIVGRNGSGKSTLLKVLAGIYAPDTGGVTINGSLAPFIELGVGFNFELSARDNLYINGSLLGLTRRRLRERYEAIVEFAELDGFMDMKLRNFSSGMQVRLAFAIAIESGADILLVDEVLAVGDERFQRKCFEIFRRRKESGQTVVFVSHDMAAVKEFCDRALLLDHGRAVFMGESRAVAHRYSLLNLDEAEQASTGEREASDPGAWIQGVRVLVDGAPVDQVPQGATVTVESNVRLRAGVADPVFGFIVTNRLGARCFVMNSRYAGVRHDPLGADDGVLVRATFQNKLAAGPFWITATLADGDDSRPLDVRRDAREFMVTAPQETGAVVDLDYDLSAEVEPAGAVVDRLPDSRARRSSDNH